MLRVAQIVTATSRVQAVVRPAGELVAPAGMTFVEIADDVPEPSGMYYVAGAFQKSAPQ